HHDKRVFVEKVDFISGAGHLDGPGGRERAGITTEGPRLCVTPRCVFDFDPESKVMRVKSLHRGITLDEVVDNMGFSPVLPGKLPTTEPPTTEELRLLREEIDPNSILRP
ncbi:MAG: CoA synthetase, partial [Dehalococcoidia bacterium]